MRHAGQLDDQSRAVISAANVDRLQNSVTTQQ